MSRVAATLAELEGAHAEHQPPESPLERGRSRRRIGRCSRARSVAGCAGSAYGGVFIVGSIAWGMAFDTFRPDRYDLVGAAICLVGVAVIMYAPR